jgi:hypothetical protein
MASIEPFIKPEDGSFDPEITRAMGQAFDAARTIIRHAAQPAAVYQSVAAKIIDAARKGEHDPARLKKAGLAGL